MTYKEIIAMFNNNLDIYFLNVLTDKRTARVLFKNGFKIINLGDGAYEIYRRKN